MAKRTHDLVATIGKYTDKDGNERKRYQKVGSAFTNDDGNLSLKIDAIPVGPEWSGWVSLYDANRERPGNAQAPQQQQQPQSHPMPGSPERSAWEAQQAKQKPHHSEIDTGEGDTIPF